MNTTPYSCDPLPKKGEVVFLVDVQHSRAAGWDHTSASLQAVVFAESVMITSLGKKQGTARTSRGNLERRLYAKWTVLCRTEAEVDAIAAALPTSAECIAAAVKSCQRWLAQYGPGGTSGTGTKLGLERNQLELDTLAKCEPLPARVEFR
jgi:hypothetical protein